MLVNSNGVAAPVYALVPANSLHTIDLSKSIRGQILSAGVHATIHRLLTKYHRPLMLTNMIAMILNVVVTGVDALTGQILSVISLALWLPLGLAAPSTLRYDVVRLILRTFDFWFFSCTTTLTALMISMYFWDLRFCRMMIDWIGFHNIVFIDGQVRGIRHVVIVTILGIPPLAFMLLWIMLDRLDGCTSFLLLAHKNKYTKFSLSGVDIIGNGMVTLSLLIVKIVARKRQTLNLRRKSSVVECVILRCGLKLEQVEGPMVVGAQRARSARTAARKNAVGPAELSRSTAREPSPIQQMTFIKFPRLFDSNHVVLPLRVGGNTFVLLYVVGAIGLLLSVSLLIDSFRGVCPEVLFAQAWGALLCTVIFIFPFAALYQRDLLKLLVTSFDFFFYTFQTTTATLSACILYDWERSRCIMLFTWALWIKWAVTLDALTPVMREKLRFHPRMAAPVVALVLLGHVAIIARVFFIGDAELHDSILYKGVLWDHEMVVRTMPFYFSRIVTLSLWCSRLIWRLSTASSSEVTILRGGVCYENNFAGRGRLRSRGATTQKILAKRQGTSLRRARVDPEANLDRGAFNGPTLKPLEAIKP